ncbi:MAG: TIGR02281 family clan AA aspartic protease [Parvularculaceae bacterium]
MNRTLLLIALGLAAVFVIGAGLNMLFPGALAAEGDRMRFVYLVALLAFVAAGGVGARRIFTGEAARNAAIWLAIGAGLLIAYSFRHEVSVIAGRVGGELAPASAVSIAPGAVELRRADGGHFIADAEVNGQRVRFLVDTGATGVALAPADARRLGFDLDALRFNQPVSTANGRTFVARTNLGEISIGDITVRDVPATIHRDGLDTSLLGMSFLNRLDGFEVSRDRMVLRQGG